MGTARFWRMGATPVPSVEIGRIALELEANGWDGLAVGEAHGLLPDPYVVLGVAATATTKLGLGTSVAVPLRHPLLAADAMATVHALSGGRGRFAIGRGDGAMKVLHREPVSVDAFERYLRALMGYLHRRDVDYEGATSSMSRLDDIDPSLALAPPRVAVAATGPKMIQASARLADALDFSVGADVERLQECISWARKAAEEAGRDPSKLEFGCYLQVAVTDGEDDAIESVRGLVVTHARFSGNFTSEAASVMETVLTSSRGGTASAGRPGELEFYPKHALPMDVVKRFGVFGTAQQCAEQISPLLELGLSHIYIGTRAVGVDLDETNSLRIGRELLPLLR